MMRTDVLPRRPEDIREAGKIEGAVRAGRRHGDSAERIAADLGDDYGLSRAEALKKIWEYDHPQAPEQDECSAANQSAEERSPGRIKFSPCLKIRKEKGAQ